MKARLYALFFALATLAACQHNAQNASPGPDKPGEVEAPISVATYNVHFLFDTVCDTPDGCGPGTFERVLTDQQYETKLADVASSIRYIDADVIMLQEVENQRCLDDLLARLDDYAYSTFGETGRPASLDVAIIAKYPLSNFRYYRDQSLFTASDGTKHKIARELIAARVDAPDHPFQVVTTHFISKASDKTGIRRVPEAEYVASVLATLRDENPDQLIVFGGDLNDTPDSAPLQRLLTAPWQLASTVRPEIQSHTWHNYALDHLIYNAADVPALAVDISHTVRICNAPAASTTNIDDGGGLNSSDHCAYRFAFRLHE